MEAISKPRAEIAMGHLELNGFPMYKGVMSEHGLNRTIFSNFDKVFSGHFHHRSNIGNVTYIGAFGEYNWSDYNDPRGFCVFDSESFGLEFIQNPHRMFRTLQYDDVSDPDIVNTLRICDMSVFTNAYVKVLVANKTNPSAFDSFLDYLYKANPIDIQLVEDALLLAEENGEDDVTNAEDTATILRKYIKDLTLPIKNDRMQSFMIDVYNEALQTEMI